MSSLPKYIVYRCSICEREVEVEERGDRPDPVRCNITNKCRGLLERVAQRSTKKFLFTPLVSGLEDYIPRGTELVKTAAVVASSQISLFSGQNIIAMSVLRKKTEDNRSVYFVIDENGLSFDVYGATTLSIIVGDPTRVYLKLFELTPEILDYKKYTYVRSEPVQIVRGADDSPEALNLRFNSSNNLSIYVNGVLLEPTAYDASVNDQITFTPTIVDTNNVIEVLVYDDIDQVVNEDQLISLEFQPLQRGDADELALRNKCAWGDYANALVPRNAADGALLSDDDTGNDPLQLSRHILYCTDPGVLDQDKSYGVAWAEVTSTFTGETRKILHSEINILLGREPYAFSDKELYAYVSGTDLIIDDSVLSYRRSQATGELTLTIDESMISQTFNQIQPRIAIPEVDDTINEESTEQQSQQLKRRYIRGPV